MDGHHKSGFVLLYMYSSRHQSELYAAAGLVNPALLKGFEERYLFGKNKSPPSRDFADSLPNVQG